MAPGSRSIVLKCPPLQRKEPKRQEVNKTLTTMTKPANQQAIKKSMPPGWLYKRDGMVLTFKVEDIVGEGSYGKVYKERILETKEIVAIKFIEIQPGYRFLEFDILKSLQHRNICQLKHSFFTQEGNKIAALLGMEYVPCSLFSVIQDCKQAHRPMGENYVKLLMFQLLTGVSYLHAKGICHRYLKPAKMLLNIFTNELKLCDFGCSKVLVDDDKNASHVCSRFYRAPEVILSCPYTKAIDLWSISCIFLSCIDVKFCSRSRSYCKDVDVLSCQTHYCRRSATAQIL